MSCIWAVWMDRFYVLSASTLSCRKRAPYVWKTKTILRWHQRVFAWSIPLQLQLQSFNISASIEVSIFPYTKNSKLPMPLRPKMCVSQHEILSNRSERHCRLWHIICNICSTLVVCPSYFWTKWSFASVYPFNLQKWLTHAFHENCQLRFPKKMILMKNKKLLIYRKLE